MILFPVRKRNRSFKPEFRYWLRESSLNKQDNPKVLAQQGLCEALISHKTGYTRYLAEQPSLHKLRS